ncbi:MAG: hypothetical protein HN368_22485 [Spirochaetales bacterium]|nr:hypothetical protein [Spirochaetales bacterium]
MRNIIIFTLLVLCSIQLFGDGQSENVSYGPLGPPVIEYFEGRVTVNGEDAVIGQNVVPGSVVQVGEESMCELVFGKRSSVVNIFENTIVIIEMDAGKSKIDLRFGALGAVFEKIQTIGEGGSFNVQTPTAVAGVRGTVFFIQVEDLSNTYLCTCNGRIDLIGSTGGDERRVSAAHHGAFRYTKAVDGAITSEAAAMLYHADEIMEEIAQKVGKVIDWSKTD